MTEEKATEEKPLEKMTATELREIAKEIPDIKGASGMKKAELLSAIKKMRGIKEEVTKSDGSVRDLKRSIKELKKKRADAIESGDSKNATILKRRISRLKRSTRRSKK
ncbi:MAG: Rho termination factor N-terminal domain-containing protein [Deltaproteobacteria bacterium]|nr:Rho termination factor N-terminal domain-containing protein [Deltaproteobacteria bacterium]